MVGIAQAGKKQYGKNLWGLGFLLVGAYLLLLDHHGLLSFFIIFGTFFIFEHIWNWGSFELFDFVGHEWLGLVLIILGTLKDVYTINSFIGWALIITGILLNLDSRTSTFSKELKKIGGK